MTRTNGSQPSNDLAYFPGKPGPAPTGVKRRVQILWMVTEMEYEYLRRTALLKNISVAEFIRSKVFKIGWHGGLASLRRNQGANIPQRRNGL